MTKIEIGDIVLIPFPYTNLLGSKLRPAIVLFVNVLDVTVLFMTTNLEFVEEFDVLLKPDAYNSLIKPSLVKISKIATVDKSLSRRNYGFLSKNDRQLIMDNLVDLIKKDS